MVVAPTADSRGTKKNVLRKKVSRQTKKADIGSKRKLAKFGKRQVAGHTGSSIHYVSRTRALRLLQISLKDFRRLCILKGIYPRDPPKKPIGKQSTAYYAAKDIAFLNHEPILSKFREMKAVSKKIARSLGRKEQSEAVRIFENRPRYTLDHVVRERYPTFESVLGDLDDPLTLINLFAFLPVSIASRDHGPKCAKLAREWHYYVAKSKTLRKSFVSVKGIYYQAEIRGIPITWLVPHKFSQDVTSLKENKEIDFRVMKTFLEFYETLLEFVMYKLYRDDLKVNYPPKLLNESENAGAFLKALHAEPIATTTSSVPGDNNEPSSKKQKIMQKKVPTSLEKVLAETALKSQLKKSQGQEEEDDEEEEESGDENVGKDFAENEEVIALKEHEKRTEMMMNLFKGLKFFLSREIPLDSAEFCVESFGGFVLREDLGDNVNDTQITHHVTDRPMVEMKPSREYIQPQWIYDCINSQMLLPCAEYSPKVESLPPHLSPFVDNEAEGYVPQRAEEIAALRKARGGGGGTEALLKARGLINQVPNEEEEEEEEPSSSEEEEEEEQTKPTRAEQEKDTVEDLDEDEYENDESKEDEDVQPQTLEAFIPAKSFLGPRPGFFFRRGTMGTGYYLDPATHTTKPEFNAAKETKLADKSVRSSETKEAKEMRTIMMSKKAKHLYGRMKHGIAKKEEEIANLERKRNNTSKESRH